MDTTESDMIAQLTVVGEQILANKYYHVAAYCILLYDHLLTFSDEVHSVWKRPKRLVFWLFLLNRYYALMAYTVVMVGFISPIVTKQATTALAFQECQHWAFFLSFGGVLPFLTSAGLLMTTRVYALYNREKWVLFYLLTLLTTVLGVGIWIYATPGGGPLLVPVSAPAFHICALLASPSLGERTSVYNWLESFFDVSVLGLTIFRVIRVSGGRGALYQRMMHDGVLYFGVIFTTNLLWGIMIVSAPPGLQFINGMPTMALTAVMVNRITMSLKEEMYGPVVFEMTKNTSNLETLNAPSEPLRLARAASPMLTINLEASRSIDVSQITRSDWEPKLLLP